MPGVQLPDLQHFPPELKALPNWVCWRYQERGGKRTKVPYSPRGGAAKSNDPSTWATLPEAQGAAERGQCDGIGFMFDGTCFGVDIDHCIDPDTGEITAEALAIAKALHSYTEFSPSGTGLHILCSGAIPTEGKRGRRKGAVEVYGKGRFFTVTGDPFGGEALPLAEKIYLTEIDADFEGDVFFPEFNGEEFIRSFDEWVDGPVPYCYVTYTRTARSAAEPVPGPRP